MSTDTRVSLAGWDAALNALTALANGGTVTSEGSIYAEPREVPLEHAAPPENEQIAAIRVLEETLSVAPRVDRDAAWRTAARAEFLNERASWRREGRKRAA